MGTTIITELFHFLAKNLAKATGRGFWWGFICGEVFVILVELTILAQLAQLPA